MVKYIKKSIILKPNLYRHVNDASVGPLRLQFASGKAASLNINGIIAENVDASLGSYAWKIPSDMKAKKYVIEAGPSASDLSFAGYVTVKKGSSDKKTISKKHTTKKHTTKKHTTKKHTTKKHTTKKHTTKKHTTIKKSSPSAVCIGYPKKEKVHERVRCHPVPKHSAKKSKKSTKKSTKKTHKTHKKTHKKTTKKHKTTTA
ncbi:unnamed protein product [Rhizopus stolonifer]